MFGIKGLFSDPKHNHGVDKGMSLAVFLVLETCTVVLTFESVDKILKCDYSNKTCFAVLWHDTICFSIFYKMKFEIFF